MDTSPLVPGPQLDVRIALEVMEGEEFNGEAHLHSQVAAAARLGKVIVVPHVEGYKSVVYSAGVWQPSTDWRAVGDVIEFLRKRGVIIHVGPGLPGEYIARLSYEPNYLDPKARQFAAPTGPLAVCMAALTPRPAARMK
ncbi:MAG TPA: hypothetical protein VG269_12905 [Tepidisphaeraceae bacterium]|jgi:hypothetical protein|nr:hypothetical protein [Tepidisphaeraceae bacterium]